jgi:hypothetical protein
MPADVLFMINFAVATGMAPAPTRSDIQRIRAQFARIPRTNELLINEDGSFASVPEQHPANSILDEQTISVEEAAFIDSLPLVQFPPRLSR